MTDDIESGNDDTGSLDDEQPRGPVEYRALTAEMDVDFAERTIELLAMPYGTDAAVLVHGRPVLESCEPGAFAGCERRANRVKVNRDHDLKRTVGRAFSLHPSRPEGLIAKLHISRTPLGDETLALADDQALEPSVGFAVMRGGERWLEQRSRRQLTKCFLDHIALVPEGAYEGRVLQVRGGDQHLEPEPRVLTPNLDEVLEWWGR